MVMNSTPFDAAGCCCLKQFAGWCGKKLLNLRAESVWECLLEAGLQQCSLSMVSLWYRSLCKPGCLAGCWCLPCCSSAVVRVRRGVSSSAG